MQYMRLNHCNCGFCPSDIERNPLASPQSRGCVRLINAGESSPAPSWWATYLEVSSWMAACPGPVALASPASAAGNHWLPSVAVTGIRGFCRAMPSIAFLNLADTSRCWPVSVRLFRARAVRPNCRYDDTQRCVSERNSRDRRDLLQRAGILQMSLKLAEPIKGEIARFFREPRQLVHTRRVCQIARKVLRKIICKVTRVEAQCSRNTQQSA